MITTGRMGKASAIAVARAQPEEVAAGSTSLDGSGRRGPFAARAEDLALGRRAIDACDRRRRSIRRADMSLPVFALMMSPAVNEPQYRLISE
ncbi:hypothetical protein [Nonomuraea sp. NPDC049158]|uniref:hypothetical protein n=1 Tax=Nonomuraea sp. NPDC049158 TaxID=3155649 RepID=UPI0033C49C49